MAALLHNVKLYLRIANKENRYNRLQYKENDKNNENAIGKE